MASIDINQPKQNKKIIFDESYIVNSEEPVAGNGSQKSKFQPKKDFTSKDPSNKSLPWYNLLIKPDAPWHQQGKQLKADVEVSSDQLTKLQEEANKILEEDSFNFKKGNWCRNVLIVILFTP